MKRLGNLRIGQSRRHVQPHRSPRVPGFETQDRRMTAQQLSVSGLQQAERLQISLEDILLTLGYKPELVQMLAKHGRNR